MVASGWPRARRIWLLVMHATPGYRRSMPDDAFTHTLPTVGAGRAAAVAQLRDLATRLDDAGTCRFNRNALCRPIPRLVVHSQLVTIVPYAEDAMTYRIGAAFGLIVLVSTHVWAAEVVDASTYTVHCDTVIGKISFKPGLTTGGSGTSASGKVEATLAGCTATPSAGGAAVTIQSGTVSGKLTSTSDDCSVLASGGPVSDSLKIVWKTTPTLLASSSVMTLSQFSFSAFFAPFPFTGIYGAFRLSASGVTGSFQDFDGGTSSFAQGTTGQDVFTLFAACDSKEGLKVVNFGFGDITLQ